MSLSARKSLKVCWRFLFVLSKYVLIRDVTKGQPAALPVQKQPRHFISLHGWVFVSPPPQLKKKKKEFSQSSKGSWKGEKGCFVVFFCFFAPVLLSRFSPPGRRGASLWQPQGCRCGMRRRQFHQALAWNKPSYKSGSSTVTTGELSAGADHRSGKFTSHWNQLLNSAAPFTIVYTYCCNK